MVVELFVKETEIGNIKAKEKAKNNIAFTAYTLYSIYISYRPNYCVYYFFHLNYFQPFFFQVNLI